MVVVEAKNQPSGLSLDSFTAVKGERFKKNLNDLRALLGTKTPEELGMSAQDHARALKAIGLASPNVEVQVHTTPETPLGHRSHPGSTILKDLEKSVNAPGIDAGDVKVVHVPLKESVTRRAAKEVQQSSVIGKPSVRLQQLAGEGARANSPEHRQAQSMLLAEGKFTNGVVKPHPDGGGKFVDSSGVLFEVLMPGASGGTSSARAVARDVIERLHAPAPKGARGQRRLILDLGHLDSGTRHEVLKSLKQNPKASTRARNILIHDRASGTLTIFEPKNIL
jgi:hypothetical protein